MAVTDRGGAHLYANQDPGDPGGFIPFQAKKDESFYNPNNGTKYHGRWFLPMVAHGQFAFERPLVLILHAKMKGPLPTDDEHLEYVPLALHLASHGYAVFSINRNLGTTETPQGDLIDSAVQHAFFKSVNKIFLRNTVILLGHSSGGKAILQHARRVVEPKMTPKQPRELKAVILLAASVTGISESKIHELKDYGSFLGINVVDDADGDAYGLKQEDKPMDSTFRVYDIIPSVEKDMIFLRVPVEETPFYAHYFQNVQPVKAYVAAFLLRNVDAFPFYASFLKHQLRPVSVGPQYIIIPQHQDRLSASLVVGNFDTVIPKWKITGSVKTATVVHTFVADEFSPHRTRALQIWWDRKAETSDVVEFSMPNPISTVGYSFLSFRIAQGYASSKPFDIRIWLNGSSVLLSTASAGGLVQPPIHVHVDTGFFFVDATKTVMRTYLIALSKFAGFNSSLTSLKFDFSVNPVPSASTFYLDSIQFWKA